MATTADKLVQIQTPVSYHRFRKHVHLVCFLLFCALPFFNIIRCDIPRQRFYFAGQVLYISEFGILFFTLMFLMFLIAAASMMYGRVYCSYLCPQMIFSEASLGLEARLRKLVTKKFIQWPAARRNLLVRAATLAAVGVASIFLAFVFIAYFVEPRDLLNRLLHLDLITAGGIAGAVTTLLTFVDFAFLRQRFCTTICPYGYLQGMLADRNTLLVQYRDDAHACIECKKCVRICHMGIDIRTSPYQIECIHCGECIDACNDVLARLKKPGLIHYVWGEQGEALGDRSRSWWFRIGLRDAKRAVVLGVLAFYAVGLTVALSWRHTVQIQLSPDRTTLFQTGPNGEIRNHFRLQIANRGTDESRVTISLSGLNGAEIRLPQNPLPLAGGETTKLEFDVAVAPNALQPGVNHFQFLTESQPDGTRSTIPMTFIGPTRK